MRAATSAKISAPRSGCPTSGRSAPTASPIRATLMPVAAYEDLERPPPSSSRNSWATLVGDDRSFAARCRCLARQLRAVQIRPYALQHVDSTNFDHPDPSIFTVLHRRATRRAPNLDFVIFPPRWMAMEDIFSPPGSTATSPTIYGPDCWRTMTPRPKVSCREVPACTTAWRGTAPTRRPSRRRIHGHVPAPAPRGHAGLHVRDPYRHPSDPFCA